MQAKHSLWLQNERYQDQMIIEHLVRANARGVKVHVMARPPHTLKKEKLLEGVGGLRILNDVGVEVRKLKGLKTTRENVARPMASGRSSDRSTWRRVVLTAGRELAIEVCDPPHRRSSERCRPS